MPHYIYACNDCALSYQNMVERGAVEATEANQESLVLFETAHRMNPTEEELSKALVCPRCQSTNATKSMHGSSFTTYVRGYGWLDKSGVARDRNTYTLLNNDPYAQYRQGDEISQIKETLQKKGKKVTAPLHFTSRVSESDVTKAVYTKNDN
jgi:hypothetical protein